MALVRHPLAIAGEGAVGGAGVGGGAPHHVHHAVLPLGGHAIEGTGELGDDVGGRHVHAQALHGAIAAREFPVIAGLEQRQGTTIFVSRGVGTVYVPVRINCPPEVAVLTLETVTRS